MPKATKETSRKDDALREADNGGAAEGLRPSDGEVSFEHLLRDMVIARQEARKKND